MTGAKAAPWWVYLIRCGDGTLYAGIARDAAARFAQHAAGKGARYTRGRGPLALVYLEPAGSQGDALRREAAIRRLGRARKEALVAAAPCVTPPERPKRRPRAPAKRRAGGS